LLLPFIAILIFSLIILRWKFFRLPGLSPVFILFVFFLKIGAGFISFNYHNTYFAGGDGAIYLNGGRDLLTLSGNDPETYIRLLANQNRGQDDWEKAYKKIIFWDSKSETNIIQDNRNAIRINSLISLMSFKSTGVHIIILIFISLIGLMALYKTFSRWFKTIYPPAVFLATFLIPSIVFWTSGILKETHTLFFFGLFLLQLSSFLYKPKTKSLLFTLLLGIAVFLVRSYLAIVLIIPVLFLILSQYFKTKAILKSLITIGFTLIIAVFILDFINLNLFEVLKIKQNEFIQVGQQANSYFSIPILNQKSDILRLMPGALINTYIQPQLFSFDSWLYIFPIIENLDILFMFFIALRYYRSPAAVEKRFLVFVIMVWFIAGWLIGILIPIQGAVTRYKALFMPFLLISIFEITDWDRLKEKFLFKL